MCRHFFFKFLNVLLVGKVNFEKKSLSLLLIETFPSLALPRNVIMLQHVIVQFSPYYLSRGPLQKVKNMSKKISNFCSKRGHGLLSLIEVVAYKRFQIQWFDLENFLYFGKLVAEIWWWLLKRGGRNRRFDYIKGRTYKNKTFHYRYIKIVYTVLLKGCLIRDLPWLLHYRVKKFNLQLSIYSNHLMSWAKSAFNCTASNALIIKSC